ncbi:MAG: urease accessory protein UreE [Rhodobacteraceae bacterium]|nr:urease accessory protein UreE [Paracoccaceae bacterium]
MTLPRATTVAHAHHPADSVALNYDERLLRRKRLTTIGGEDVLVDLPETVSVDDGACLMLEDGRAISVHAADEPLLEIRGDLARLAWHIGNRHTPCQIFNDRLVIRQDHVLRAMLVQLGAEIVETLGPFTPEGGAYGHGRTFGHSHD